VKVYRCLEKSLSFRDRKQEFGWDAVAKLVRFLSSIKSKVCASERRSLTEVYTRLEE
jgi:hypothetical protein